MSCPHHSGPSRWRVTFKAAPGVFYTLDCWADARKVAVRNSRKGLGRLHPGLRAKLVGVAELVRKGRVDTAAPDGA